MLRRASLTFLFVVFLPATVQAFDHHHHHSSSHGGSGCSSSHSSSSPSGAATVDAQKPPAQVPATGEKLVFVTSTTYSGALGGLNAADLHCQASAKEANLPGRYRAWLSTTTESAASRITGNGPWHTVDGSLAFADANQLEDAPDVALLPDDAGDVLGPVGAVRPWTGTGASGAASGQDCDGWTNATAELDATVGTAAANDIDWGGGNTTTRCDQKAPLICFEVD